MHFCQDEFFMVIMAIQNGPLTAWRFITAWFSSLWPERQWLPEDCRSWQQAKVDMDELQWDKASRRWVRSESVEVDLEEE